VFVSVLITLTPLLVRSAKYIVFVEGSKDQTSVLVLFAPVGVQVGIEICFKKSKPASGVGEAATAFVEKPWSIERKKKVDNPIMVFKSFLILTPFKNFMLPPKRLQSR
jgi:hypothetical protein